MCTINGNTAALFGRGGGIACYEFSSPLIEYCEIYGNSIIYEDGFGGGIYSGGGSPAIDHCTISGNSIGYEGRGAGICIEGSQVHITYCLITGNVATENPYTGYGGGISCLYSSPIIENSTIYGNSAGSNGLGGGIYVTSGGTPTVTNCIINGNVGEGGTYFDGLPVDAYVTYSDFYGNGSSNFAGNIPEHLGVVVNQNANGDPCDIYYNIFLNPQFVNPSGGDYHLQSGSPCIDAGDPTSPLDPDSTIADIGAFYFNQLGVTENPHGTLEPSTFQLFPNYPNPFNPTTDISYYLPHSSEIRVDIYNLLGQRVETLFNGMQEGGVHSVRWDASNSASGIYFVRLQSQKLIQIRKMLLLK